MPALLVLATPEFGPLLDVARRLGYETRDLGDYTEITADGDLVVPRADTELRDALWYGALTAGFRGRLARFDDTELRIVGDG